MPLTFAAALLLSLLFLWAKVRSSNDPAFTEFKAWKKMGGSVDNKGRGLYTDIMVQHAALKAEAGAANGEAHDLRRKLRVVQAYADQRDRDCTNLFDGVRALRNERDNLFGQVIAHKDTRGGLRDQAAENRRTIAALRTAAKQSLLRREELVATAAESLLRREELEQEVTDLRQAMLPFAFTDLRFDSIVRLPGKSLGADREIASLPGDSCPTALTNLTPTDSIVRTAPFQVGDFVVREKSCRAFYPLNEVNDIRTGAQRVTAVESEGLRLGVAGVPFDTGRENHWLAEFFRLATSEEIAAKPIEVGDYARVARDMASVIKCTTAKSLASDWRHATASEYRAATQEKQCPVKSECFGPTPSAT